MQQTSRFIGFLLVTGLVCSCSSGGAGQDPSGAQDPGGKLVDSTVAPADLPIIEVVQKDLPPLDPGGKDTGITDPVSADPGGVNEVCIPGDAGCQPDGEERCNGVDDDCDGETDEGCGECRDAVCAPYLCTEECEDAACLLQCCDGSCNLCHDGSVCLKGDCCMPDCCGRECGSDGCSGWCGNCPKWHKCEKDSGQCEVYNECGVWEGQVGCQECSCQLCVCQADPFCCDNPWDAKCVSLCKNQCGGCLTCDSQCAGMECGLDGCGGSCGDCPPGQGCQGGQCVPCLPDCTGKECGDDGCGGSCGTCPELDWPGLFATEIQVCNTFGQCECGRCDYSWSDNLMECDPGGCSMMICMPDCTGKECGDDGCAGICGVCGWGAICHPYGECSCDLPVDR